MATMQHHHSNNYNINIIDNNNNNNHNNCYDDRDADIIDMFMENVFYLIGVSPVIVPAAAA